MSTECRASMAAAYENEFDISIALWQYCSDSVHFSHSRRIYFHYTVCVNKVENFYIDANARFSPFFIANTELLIRVWQRLCGIRVCLLVTSTKLSCVPCNVLLSKIYYRCTNREEIGRTRRTKIITETSRDHMWLYAYLVYWFGRRYFRTHYVNWHQNHIYSVEISADANYEYTECNEGVVSRSQRIKRKYNETIHVFGAV